MGRVLAISSHVVRGHVGLAASVPALQRLGHEVWALPTVVLASRPGLGRLERRDTPAAELAAMLEALEADGCWPMLDGVLTGYFVTPEAVAAAARALERIRQARRGVRILVDPVLGDGGQLYVREDTALAIRRDLLPLADVATPNLTELAWLAGAGAGAVGAGEAEALARRLGVPTVVVTSAAESAAGVATLLVTADRSLAHSTPRRAGIPNGAGDLLAGLLLGNLLDGRTAEAALEASLAALDRVLAASAGGEVLQLAAL